MQSRHGSTLSCILLLALHPGCYTGADPGLREEPPPPAALPPADRLDHPVVPLELDALSPDPAPGGVEFMLRVTGAGFDPGTVVLVDGDPLPTTFVSPGELLAASPARPRGDVEVEVRRGERRTDPLRLRVGNAAPRLVVPPEVHVAEDQPLELAVTVTDVDDPTTVRIFAAGLPPGAVWDEPARALRFTPDFIQGGATHTVTFLAADGFSRAEASVDIVVDDTIRPPDPTIVTTEPFTSHVRYTLEQTTDDYLDSPGHAGRSFAAILTVPVDPPEAGAAVRINLHGIGVAEPDTSGSASELRLAPHDPDSTYWWGYADSLPDAPPTAGGVVPDYTVRRVLHLLEWVLRNHPEADPARVHLFGGSMGGAGAMTIGLLRARHFAYVDARFGQAIPRNHRPSRLAQLSGLWGDPDLGLDSGRGAPVWEFMDLTRALADSPEARDQFVFTKHGKDDPIIHFGAAVLASPLTDTTLYGALRDARVGHFAVWDEGGHGPADPVLGDRWWSSTWAPMSSDSPVLRSDLAFPALTGSSLDDDPGDGEGNGMQAWSPNSGYAGDSKIPGDSGWNGDIAGAIGRHLRWDPTTLVDTFDRFQVALRVLDGEGDPPPADGYPSTGDLLLADLPALVDVTPRRTQSFRCRPGEVLSWSFGQMNGTVTADADGSVTVPELPLTTEWATLTIRRDARPLTHD